MTIPEACQLILQVSVIGQSGEIYVLDMGEIKRQHGDSIYAPHSTSAFVAPLQETVWGAYRPEHSPSLAI
jgi:hypothetical protein